MPFDGFLETGRRAEAAPGGDQLAALHRRTGVLVHDVNNLLNVILGANEALAAGLAEGSEGRELAEMSQAAAEKGAELLRQLLDLAETNCAAAIDCGGAIAGVARLARLSAPRGVRIETAAVAPGLACAADRSGLDAALLNLVVNAGHAMPEGGAITLSADAADLDGAIAAGLGVRPGRYVAFTVEDTGVGMSPETLARAQEPFFTTRRGTGGTGLGLTSVRDFAEAAGGALSLASAPGQGTTARLYLRRV